MAAQAEGATFADFKEVEQQFVLRQILLGLPRTSWRWRSPLRRFKLELYYRGETPLCAWTITRMEERGNTRVSITTEATALELAEMVRHLKRVGCLS
jgi:hypothetical protein